MATYTLIKSIEKEINSLKFKGNLVGDLFSDYQESPTAIETKERILKEIKGLIYLRREVESYRTEISKPHSQEISDEEQIIEFERYIN